MRRESSPLEDQPADSEPRLVVKNTFIDFHDPSAENAPLETRPSTWAHGLNLLARGLSSESLLGCAGAPCDSAEPPGDGTAATPAAHSASVDATAESAGASAERHIGGSSGPSVNSPRAGLPRRSSRVSFASLAQVCENDSASENGAASSAFGDASPPADASPTSASSASPGAAPHLWNKGINAAADAAPGGGLVGDALGSARFVVKNTFIELGEEASANSFSRMRSVHTAPFALNAMA